MFQVCLYPGFTDQCKVHSAENNQACIRGCMLGRHQLQEADAEQIVTIVNDDEACVGHEFKTYTTLKNVAISPFDIEEYYLSPMMSPSELAEVELEQPDLGEHRVVSDSITSLDWMPCDNFQKDTAECGAVPYQLDRSFTNPQRAAADPYPTDCIKSAADSVTDQTTSEIIPSAYREGSEYNESLDLFNHPAVRYLPLEKL